MVRPTKLSRVSNEMLNGLGLSAEEIAGLTDAERAYLFQCLEEAAETGVSQTAVSLLLEDYKWEPVSMEQFLSDPYYMGEVAKDLYPVWKAVLIEAFDGPQRPTEIILGGALGGGKTTVMTVIFTYMAYRLTCLRDPHTYYSLMKGAPIVIGLYSISLDQAMSTSYGKMLSWFDQIPYFLQKCPRVKRINSVIKFTGSPLQIIAGSNEKHTIGRDMFCFGLDESNFFSAGKGTDDPGVAFNLYTNASRRVKTRFMTGRGEPAGITVLASSKRTKMSFLEQHVKDVDADIKDGKTRVYSFAQWEVKPAALFKLPRFHVEIGDRIYPSRVLRDGDNPRPGADVITVPGEFRRDFDQDCEKALRDLAGVASESMMPLFHDRSIIQTVCDAQHQHPFSRDEVTLDIRDDVGLDAYFIPQRMFRVTNSTYEMRLNPGAGRYIHIDVGFTQDALGIGMCHLAGIKSVRRARKDGTWYEDKAPFYVVDFVLRVVPPKGSEIDIAKVRAFVLSLRDMGCPIRRVTYDSHQSRESVQAFRKLGFSSDMVSVDRTDEAYLNLRQMVVERRVSMYRYPHLLTELGELERDVDKRKVDHPKISPTTGRPGSKDCADGLSGCLHVASLDRVAWTQAIMATVPVSSVVSPGSMATRVAVPGGSMLWSELDREASR
jgi:phage FluMu protein Com